MNFDPLDMISALAKERQKAMIAEAAERRMVRLARDAHPSRRRFASIFRSVPRSPRSPSRT